MDCKKVNGVKILEKEAMKCIKYSKKKLQKTVETIWNNVSGRNTRSHSFTDRENCRNVELINYRQISNELGCRSIVGDVVESRTPCKKATSKKLNKKYVDTVKIRRAEDCRIEERYFKNYRSSGKRKGSVFDHLPCIQRNKKVRRDVSEDVINNPNADLFNIMDTTIDELTTKPTIKVAKKVDFVYETPRTTRSFDSSSTKRKFSLLENAGLTLQSGKKVRCDFSEDVIGNINATSPSEINAPVGKFIDYEDETEKIEELKIGITFSDYLRAETAELTRRRNTRSQSKKQYKRSTTRRIHDLFDDQHEQKTNIPIIQNCNVDLNNENDVTGMKCFGINMERTEKIARFEVKKPRINIREKPVVDSPFVSLKPADKFMKELRTQTSQHRNRIDF